MKRAVVVTTAVVGAVLLGAGAVGVWALTRSPGAERAASAYLDALADGDGSSAAGMLSDATAASLSAEVGLTAATATIANPRVDDIDETGDIARATVSFTLGGDAVDAEFGLSRTADGWRVDDDGLGMLTVTTTRGDSVWLGGSLLRAPVTALVLPAAYEAWAAPADVLDASATVAVVPGAAVEASLNPVLDSRAVELAQESIDDYADTCASVTEEVPDRCGIRVPWAADLASVDSMAVRIVDYPRVALLEGDSFAATDGALVVVVSGVTRSGSSATEEYSTDAWSLHGTYELTGNEMVLKVF